MSIFAQNEQILADSAAVCDKGGRGHNEDYVARVENTDLCCYVVCDGLGGHRGGEVASETAAEAFVRSIGESDVIDADSVGRAAEFAQECLVNKFSGSSEPGLKPRTTIAALIVSGKKAFICHAGDSRVYHFRGGAINSVTNDHSVAFLSYLSGEIEYSEIRKSPDQNRLIRSLGDSEKFNPEISEPINIQPGDAFLLCSDGFWEYVDEADIEKALKNSKTASRWLAKMVRVLNKNTKNAEENDNYSAITVFIR